MSAAKCPQGCSDWKQNDSGVLIIGPVGCGKSQLVNNILGRKLADVCHSLVPSKGEGTSEVNIYPHPKSERAEDGRWLLIDTPGLNQGTNKPIVEGISIALAHLYQHGVKVDLVVYLWPIVAARATSSNKEDFEILQRLVGNAMVPDIIFGTTRWPKDEGAVKKAEKSHEELRTSVFTKYMGLQPPSVRLLRLRSPEEAKKVLTTFPPYKKTPQVQTEMGSDGVKWQKTEVGKYLNASSSRLDHLLEDVWKWLTAHKLLK
ncbi:hypothetical protein FA15DRAFT_655559 [Coprinopsis marcescibilis]|uniref:G domain-containing protein n=1 Tax=Coprinopsis marcescibilis TaxID=230819 RepID=A0A5C3KW63_COPMA|nr:hypothetical protein FA15DRAFT_655559 [Coprinopsis marcescibilis]